MGVVGGNIYVTREYHPDSQCEMAEKKKEGSIRYSFKPVTKSPSLITKFSSSLI